MRKNKHWTQAEKDYVCDVWGEIPLKRIAKNIGKTPNAIERFAERNKLGGAIYNDSYLTPPKASEIIGVDPTTILTWVKTNKLKARKTTLRRKKVYLIDPNDFRNFLRDNQDKWNATKLQQGFFDVEVDWLIKKLDRDSNPTISKSGSSWTVLEEKKLVELVQLGHKNREIAEILNRTTKSVASKRTRLMREIA